MPSSLTNDLSWQLGDTGVIINDDLTPGAAYIDIEKAPGWDSAPFRETKRDHEGVDGGFMDAVYEQGRDVSLTGTVYFNGNPIFPFLDRLKANWAPSNVLVPLYFRSNEVGTRVLFVKPLGVKYDIDTGLRIGATAIQFSAYAEDPRIYTDFQNDFTLTVGATVYTGIGFPFGFSFGFGGVSSTTDGVTMTVGGNRPTPPLFTITGPVVNPHIYNVTTSNEMSFNTTLGVGETLVIDTQYRTVRFMGTSNRRGTMMSTGWFFLQPGSNFIRFRSENASDTGTLLIQYRDAWR